MNDIDEKILGPKQKWFDWRKKIILIIIAIGITVVYFNKYDIINIFTN